MTANFAILSRIMLPFVAVSLFLPRRSSRSFFSRPLSLSLRFASPLPPSPRHRPVPRFLSLSRSLSVSLCCVCPSCRFFARQPPTRSPFLYPAQEPPAIPFIPAFSAHLDTAHRLIMDLLIVLQRFRRGSFYSCDRYYYVAATTGAKPVSILALR